nr:MAG TPA: hypothetical protein [Caudoviricetes sp.]
MILLLAHKMRIFFPKPIDICALKAYNSKCKEDSR